MKPENVRCGGCVFWKLLTRKGKTPYGECRIRAGAGHEVPKKLATDWCGEFRETWPVERVPIKHVLESEATI
jgi:hypothetical protein